MKRFKIANLPIELLDRLAKYAKMDWWFTETASKKTVTVINMADLECAFLEVNLRRFTDEEKLQLFVCFVLCDVSTEYGMKELIKSMKEG